MITGPGGTRRFLAFVLLVTVLAACMTEAEREARRRTGGTPKRGLELIRRYGCAACHIIPGVEGSVGQKGPALAGVASRDRIAGGLANTPENVLRWIRHPETVDRYTEMPNMGISETEGRDIAAYLYTLR